MMQRLSSLSFDRKVRLGGAGLLVFATLCLTLIPGHRADPAVQPSMAEFVLALVAVCAGSVGASFLFVGRQLFDPVPDPRSHRPTSRKPRDRW